MAIIAINTYYNGGEIGLDCNLCSRVGDESNYDFRFCKKVLYPNNSLAKGVNSLHLFVMGSLLEPMTCIYPYGWFIQISSHNLDYLQQLASFSLYMLMHEYSAHAQAEFLSYIQVFSLGISIQQYTNFVIGDSQLLVKNV